MNNARNTAPDLGKFHGRRIAVTGATGMLGSHLVAELLRAGYTDITLPVRDAARIAVTEAALRRLGVHAPEGALKIIETPLTDPVRLDEKVRDIDTVFNCAARIMSGDMTTEQLIANNVAIARSVTNWCLTTGVRKLIHVSSISALGNPTGPGLPVTEECDPESVTDYAAYGQSKYYSEQEVRRGAAAGLPTVIVSPGVILGEGDTTSNNSAALIPAISCGQPFYTEGLMSYVDVRDVARAMVLLDAAPQAVGERFILSAGDLSYRELIIRLYANRHRTASDTRPGRHTGEPRQRPADDTLRRFKDNEVLRLHLYAAPRNGGTGGRSLPKQKKEERGMTNISVIIVAGGSGTRMGAAVPKQFLPLEEEETILEATLRRFLAALPDSEIVVVLPAAETERWREICRQRGISETHRLCSGGATRFESVRNGIAALGPCDYIAVHDGVRPLVTERLIHTCVATAERYGTAVPAIRPADSFRRVDATTGKSRPVDRETLRAVQTPQVFRADLLRRAYKADYRPEFTDDASVVEANGEQVTLCEGERTNIKITSPADLLIARILRHAGDGKETDSL